MKKIFFAALFISALAFKPAEAQFSIKLNLNIGSQPDWGPTGYDHAEYYYMPDIDTYYDVPNHQYVYNEGGRWVRGAALPPRYANYDRYHGYKVVINQPQPYLHANVWRAKYANYRGRRDQQVIRDSRDNRYRDNRPHGNGDNGWHGDHREDNRGGHDDHGRGHDDHGRGHDDHGDH